MPFWTTPREWTWNTSSPRSLTAVMPSTLIRRTEYDPDKRILSVWLVTSGKRYEFEDVPPETFAAFRSAFAKGRYFNSHIRNQFRYRRSDS
ncbi:KTSC domain-containing protein [Mesorhizobium sp.]|uniref:KTSC domain-containing protein n=2 Tax=Mesorhizobium sp. TaxID=1871066 RepID=UPI0026AD5E82